MSTGDESCILILVLSDFGVYLLLLQISLNRYSSIQLVFIS